MTPGGKYDIICNATMNTYLICIILIFYGMSPHRNGVWGGETKSIFPLGWEKVWEKGRCTCEKVFCVGCRSGDVTAFRL